MILTKLYAVFDSCAGIFGDIICADSDAIAKRFFEYALSDPTVPDYVRKDSVLYTLGDFNRDTGKTNSIVPVVIARGCNVIPSPKKEAAENEE